MGTVLKSTDSGDTWCQLDAGTISDLYGAEAVSDSEYFVCGAGGLLLRTTNGGGTCATTSVPEASGLAPGIYMVRVRTGAHAEAMRRLVITR